VDSAPCYTPQSKFIIAPGFVRFFIPALTGMVGFWATVALNIPDFTRYAKSQRAQMVGQALGLPAAMTLYSFIGVAVTSASAVIFGEAIWDPVFLLGRFNQPLVALIALNALLLATLNTNVAANVGVSFQRFLQSAAESHFLPDRRPHYRRGGHFDDAVETASRFQFVHFWLAGRLFGAARTNCRDHDLRITTWCGAANSSWRICIFAVERMSICMDSTQRPSLPWSRGGRDRIDRPRSSSGALAFRLCIGFVGFVVSGGLYFLLMQKQVPPCEVGSARGESLERFLLSLSNLPHLVWCILLLRLAIRRMR